MTPSRASLRMAVIGAGPGGYAAAFRAADLGLSVTLIDREPNPGGVCLHRGCIPSKALLHVAKIVRESDDAAAWGVTFGDRRIDVDRLREKKCSIVEKLSSGLGQLCRARGIRQVQGSAVYRNSQTIEVTIPDDRTETIQADYSILATGSAPSSIPGLAIDDPRLLDSTGALDLIDVPRSLLVIGGGYIGLEIGTVYQALGSRVTIVEMTSGLLPGADRDLVQILEQQLRSRSLSIRLNTVVSNLRASPAGLDATFRNNAEASSTKTFDKVMMAVGRKPNSSGLGLENTRVQIDRRGIVQVNEQRRTADERIFAVGDIAGEPMLAHKAAHEGRVAAEAIAGHKVAFEPRAIPAVVFTDPELAWCGLTELRAKELGRKVVVSKFPWAVSGRALTLGRTDGLTKIVSEPDTGRILGVGLCGPGAGELIAEGTLAMEMAATVDDLRLSIHPHPTLSETLMETAELFFGPSTHIYRPTSG